ncbi:hypothetical protein [Paenibacillus pinistramenti]|uniref:hypothetical protein n=1 Tax=Paenibacillus pinistramenti TaxID=1768003 RepID=UPI0011096E64|nr:hypothetical protein [Paenibacillus pinistramenti]
MKLLKSKCKLRKSILLLCTVEKLLIKNFENCGVWINQAPLFYIGQRRRKMKINICAENSLISFGVVKALLAAINFKPQNKHEAFGSKVFYPSLILKDLSLTDSQNPNELIFITTMKLTKGQRSF